MAQGRGELYPVFLDLRGLPVLVVGAGGVAARKVRALLQARARVTVVAPRFGPRFTELRGLRRRRRAFRAQDLRGARLVFAATDDRALNTRVAVLAERRGVWANVAAPPEAGRLLVPACLRRGRLCIAVSTAGVSAAAARALRREWALRLGPSWGAFLDLLASRRARILKLVPDPRRRRRLLQTLGAPRWVRLIQRRGRAAVARAMDRLIRQAAP